jgi:hypothetical protein
MRLVLLVCAAAACSPPEKDVQGAGDGGGTPSIDAGSNFPDARPQVGCGELEGCYTTYANSDRILYHVDLVGRELIEIGPFEIDENMTDIAVDPDGQIFGISETAFYRIDAGDGHATRLAALESCGTFGVALTFGPDGTLYAGDFQGAFCRIDVSMTPPDVIRVGDLGNNLALAGDLVAVSDGTLFGTAYDTSFPASQDDNFLVEIDPATGHATRVPGGNRIGWGRLFGVGYDVGTVFAFTHDGTGEVVTVDPASGDGTLYATFTDPVSGDGIAFAGAGVSSLVPAEID